MRDYDLIALDLDGTVLGPDGKVSPATLRAVRRALEVGYRVVFATGRNYQESWPVIDEIGHHGAAVFVGGASVIETSAGGGGGRTLHRQTMEPALAVAVCAAFERLDLSPLVFQDDPDDGLRFVRGRLPFPDAVKRWHELTRATVRRVDDVLTADHSHTMRVSALGPPAVVDEALALLEAQFGERVFAYKTKLANFGVELLEVFDPSVNKWAGIEHVAREHGIPRERVVAVGDDMNDLHMIREAGLGVAMGNARPVIKEIADRVIASHAEDGLATFLDELSDQASD